MDIFGRKRIAALELDNTDLQAELAKLYEERTRLFQDISLNLTINNRAIGRLIAKLDPTFAQDEADPTRKAESDNLGDSVIAKLRGEYLASR